VAKLLLISPNFLEDSSKALISYSSKKGCTCALAFSKTVEMVLIKYGKYKERSSVTTYCRARQL
jgi:hypothetical protein